MRLLTLWVLLCCALSTSALAQDKPVASISTGFFTGNEYRDQSSAAKLGYVVGLIDGLLGAPMFGSPKEQLAWLERCIVGMTNRSGHGYR